MVKLVTLADIAATRKVLKIGSQTVRDVAQTAILDGGRLNPVSVVGRRALPQEFNPDVFIHRGENQKVKIFGPDCPSNYSYHPSPDYPCCPL